MWNISDFNNDVFNGEVMLEVDIYEMIVKWMFRDGVIG